MTSYLLAPALLIQALTLNIPSTEGAGSFPRAVVLTPLRMSKLSDPRFPQEFGPPLLCKAEAGGFGGGCVRVPAQCPELREFICDRSR